MTALQWIHLADVQGRLNAELLASFLQAHEIEVELIQEAVGHLIYPVEVDSLGRVQIFVPKEQAHEARQLLSELEIDMTLFDAEGSANSLD
ncbi:MAG: hypothetical protein N2049_07120 [Anaerolineales bacterium]|nr:hypothetical protein [Anaerolineales bacterium]MCX7608972.1 hypothetical protein [Anaerolineales bacterium]